MDMVLTFSDGQSAYLSHHGTKGMKWGVWNAETRAKYSGGDSSFKGAKKTIRDLNRLDKRRAVEIGKMSAADKKAFRYADKAQKQGRGMKAGQLRKSFETIGKANAQLDKARAHEKAIKGIEEQQKNLSSKLVKEGYSVKTKTVSRSTLTKGERVLATAVLVASYASPSPVAVYYDDRTSGTKYKLNKSK